MKENIETDIKIALDRFLDNKDINSAIFIVEQFILGNYILVGGKRKIPKECLRYILSEYKRIQKENEELRAKLDKDTHILQNELDLTNADKINNYIPVQKVKNKIELLEEKAKYEQNAQVLVQLYKQIKVLKELLKEKE